MGNWLMEEGNNVIQGAQESYNWITSLSKEDIEKGLDSALCEGKRLLVKRDSLDDNEKAYYFGKLYGYRLGGKGIGAGGEKLNNLENTLKSIFVEGGEESVTLYGGLYVPGGKSMLGENGIQTASHTVKNFKGGGRIDIENPAPGKRPGQIHYQQVGDKNKYYYNPETKKFHIGSSNGELASSKIQDLLDNSEIMKAINKGLDLLNGK